MAPRNLAASLHSLPPILHKLEPDSMASYSKAPWGLSVLVWGIRIFTDNPISPSPSSRQRSTRYSIRSGPLRQLPEHEQELDREQELIVYCRSGSRSWNAAEYLQAQGFRNIVNLDGGMRAWAERIDPSMPTY